MVIKKKYLFFPTIIKTFVNTLDYTTCYCENINHLFRTNFFTLSSRLHTLFLDSLTIKPLSSREISRSNVPLDVNLSLQ